MEINKKKIVIFIFIVIIVIFCVCLEKRKQFYKNVDSIEENDILFIYDSSEQYFSSFYSSIEELKYYNKVYNLKIKYFDLKGRKKNYKKLKQKDKDLVYFYKPILQVFKKNNSIFSEDISDKEKIYEFLKNNNLIDKNNLYEILYSKKFNQTISENLDNLVIIENGDNNSIELRKKVYNLSNKYKFKFYSFEPFLFKNVDVNYSFESENLPCIIVFKNNKEKLVISNASLKTIEKRLKTINFIKEEKNEK